jgi:hypothetical protein
MTLNTIDIIFTTLMAAGFIIMFVKEVIRYRSTCVQVLNISYKEQHSKLIVANGPMHWIAAGFLKLIGISKSWKASVANLIGWIFAIVVSITVGFVYMTYLYYIVLAVSVGGLVIMTAIKAYQYNR